MASGCNNCHKKSRELAEMEANLQKAAEAGSNLLKEREGMKSKLRRADEVVKELKVEKTKLETQVTASKKLEAENNDELDCLRTSIDKKNTEIQELQAAKSQLVNNEISLKEQNGNLQKQLDDKEDEFSKLKVNFVEAKQAKQRLEEDLKHNDGQMLSKELQESRDEVTSLEEKCSDLSVKLASSFSEIKQLREISGMLEKAMKEAEKGREEMKRINEEMKDSLQSYREQNTNLEEQTQLLQQQLAFSGVGKKGNSLYAEVDDERASVESKLKKMREKFLQLKGKYDTMDEKLLKSKLDNIALTAFTKGSCESDSSYISRLEGLQQELKKDLNVVNSNYSKVSQENEMLKRELETIKLVKFIPDEVARSHTSGLLDSKRRELESRKKELERERIQSNTKMERWQECEGRLRLAEQDLDQLRHDKLQLQAKVKELQISIEEVAKRGPSDGGSSDVHNLTSLPQSDASHFYERVEIIPLERDPDSPKPIEERFVCVSLVNGRSVKSIVSQHSLLNVTELPSNVEEEGEQNEPKTASYYIKQAAKENVDPRKRLERERPRRVCTFAEGVTGGEGRNKSDGDAGAPTSKRGVTREKKQPILIP